MSSEIAIKVEDLSKCYEIYDQPRDRLKQFILPRTRRLLGLPPKRYYREFWALRNVSFEVKKGETVGIVGRNGSGKSTLLQMVCGTLSPTRGTILTNGRIAALLELGSGFNPEFTGRENVYLNGSVLGLSRTEIEERFADIVAFADIGDFIDQPVKSYSSGMVVRLAFAVAVNSDPEVLVVDEALSVGDELFQRKCFSRINAIRSNGATILFVSHSGTQIVELCDRAILIDSGEKLIISLPKQTIGLYQRMLYALPNERDSIRDLIIKTNATENALSFLEANDSRCKNDGNITKINDFFDPNLVAASTINYPFRGAIIEEPKILNSSRENVNNLIQGEIYHYSYSVLFEADAKNVIFGMLIKTVSGVELGGASSAESVLRGIPLAKRKERHFVEFQFQCNLNPGVYFLNAGVYGLINGEETFLHRMLDVIAFRVFEVNKSINSGFIDFKCKFNAGNIEAVL